MVGLSNSRVGLYVTEHEGGCSSAFDLVHKKRKAEVKSSHLVRNWKLFVYSNLSPCSNRSRLIIISTLVHFSGFHPGVHSIHRLHWLMLLFPLLRLCVTYTIRKEKYKSVTGILDETIVKLFFCFPCFFFWTWMTPVWPSSLLWTSEPFHVLNQNKKDTTEYSCEMKCCMYKQLLTYSLGLKMS